MKSDVFRRCSRNASTQFRFSRITPYHQPDGKLPFGVGRARRNAIKKTIPWALAATVGFAFAAPAITSAVSATTTQKTATITPRAAQAAHTLTSAATKARTGPKIDATTMKSAVTTQKAAGQKRTLAQAFTGTTSAKVSVQGAPAFRVHTAANALTGVITSSGTRATAARDGTTPEGTQFGTGHEKSAATTNMHTVNATTRDGTAAKYTQKTASATSRGAPAVATTITGANDATTARGAPQVDPTTTATARHTMFNSVTSATQALKTPFGLASLFGITVAGLGLATYKRKGSVAEMASAVVKEPSFGGPSFG